MSAEETTEPCETERGSLYNRKFVDLYAAKLTRGEIPTAEERAAWNEIRIAAKKLRGEVLIPSEEEIWNRVESEELKVLAKEVNLILTPKRPIEEYDA